MKKYFITLGLAVFALVSVVHAQEYTFSRDLSVGTTGPDVIALQSWLITNGYAIPAISSGSALKGYFGSQTKNAVMNFQSFSGLPRTGYFGPLSRGKIGEKKYTDSHTLSIQYPNGGENWQKGTSQTISWSSPLYIKATYADIKLRHYEPPCTGQICPASTQSSVSAPYRVPYRIATNISINQNSYIWNVGTIFSSYECPSGYSCMPNVLSDGQYTIEICEAGTSNCDSSDKPFTISSRPLPPSETVISPNGGEVWTNGLTHRISWSMTNLADANAPLDIYLDPASTSTCTDSALGRVCVGTTVPLGRGYVLDRNILASSIYNWIVGTDINNAQIPNGNYKVRVCKAGSSTDCDSSDASFMIEPPPVSF